MVDEKAWNEIVTAEDIIPEQHDGTYILLPEIVKAYKNVSQEKWNVDDLDAIYLAAIGTWRVSYQVKIERIWKTNLPQASKQKLTLLVRSLHTEAKQNRDSEHIGMFGTGFMSFKKSFPTDTSKTDLRRFIQLLIDVVDGSVDDEEMLLLRVDREMQTPIKGINAAVLSVLLHCLQPCVFPIINGAMGVGSNGFAQLGIVLKSPKDAKEYINNVRLLKTFRDTYCCWKNYRVIDYYFIVRRKYYQNEKPEGNT